MNQMTEKLFQAGVIDKDYVGNLPRREAERVARREMKASSGGRIKTICKLSKLSNKPYKALVEASKFFTNEEIQSVVETVQVNGWEPKYLPQEFHRV